MKRKRRKQTFSGQVPLGVGQVHSTQARPGSLAALECGGWWANACPQARSLALHLHLLRGKVSRKWLMSVALKKSQVGLDEEPRRPLLRSHSVWKMNTNPGVNFENHICFINKVDAKDESADF